MKQLLVIIGMPGSGKDTQIDYLAKRKKFEVIRIGDLVRAKAKTDPTIGAELKAGELVENEVVNNLVSDAIKSADNGSYLISDGFPRDLEQARWLDEFAKNNNCSIEIVLLINITDEVAMERLTSRGREDDDEATIRHRLEVFHAKTDRVVEYYQLSERISTVDGIAKPAQVAEEIERILGW